MKVHIQEPCNEKWNEMTPQEQGRHCAKCDKVVVDFSKKDDYAILSHFDKNDNTCGRFQHWQLEKELKLPTLHNPWTRWIKNAAFGSFLFGGSIAAQTNDKTDSLMQTTEVSTLDSLTKTNRSVTVEIQQPGDTVNQLKELRFSIDSFQISVQIDSNQISFALPDSVTGDTITVQLITDVDSTILTLPIEAKDTTYFNFEYFETWRHQPYTQWDYGIDTTQDLLFEITNFETVIYGGFTTGVSIMQPPGPTIPFSEILDKYPLIPHENKTVPVDDVSRISMKGAESVQELKMQQTSKASRDLIVYNKRKSSVWWWLLPIPVLLFFAGYYWKKRQAMIDNI